MVQSQVQSSCERLRIKCASMLQYICVLDKSTKIKTAFTGFSQINQQKPSAIRNPNKPVTKPNVNSPQMPQPIKPPNNQQLENPKSQLPSFVESAVEGKLGELQKTINQYRQTVNSPNTTNPQLWHNTQGQLRRLNEQMEALKNFAQKNNIVIPKNK